ncbi:hypothetical protein ZORO111903_05460 [Zobellia roscoffensis]
MYGINHQNSRRMVYIIDEIHQLKKLKIDKSLPIPIELGEKYKLKEIGFILF